MAGGIAGNVDPESVGALRRFGVHYGVLFQITDDLLDVLGDSKTVGKTLGKDAAHQKLTYPSLYGIETAKRMAQEEARFAKEALGQFGDRATWFLTLTDQTLTRTF